MITDVGMNSNYEIVVDVPQQLAPADEVDAIMSEFGVGVALREIALYRIYRLWRDGSYVGILSQDPLAGPGVPQFGTWTDFLKHLLALIDVSRSRVYTRLKVYSLLSFLGYTERQMVSFMAKKPGLFERALNMIYVWDQDLRMPTAMRTDEFGSDINSEETKENVRYFLEELFAMDSVSEALSHLTRDVLHKPVLKIRWESPSIVVHYENPSYDEETGEEITSDAGDIVFEYADGVLPEWVNMELDKKFNAAK